MNEISAWIYWALGILSLISSSEAAYIIKKAWNEKKARKQASNNGDEAALELLNQLATGQTEIKAALQTQLTAALNEISILKTEKVVKDRKITRLERERNEVRAMLEALKKV